MLMLVPSSVVHKTMEGKMCRSLVKWWDPHRMH